MEGFLLAHPRGSRAFLWGFGAFFSCALFPALPVSGSPWHMWWLGTLAGLWAWQEAGRMQAALFPGRGIGALALWNLGAALAGLGCRFLLEFGEVTNAVNFTAPNVLLHLLPAAGVPALWAWQPGAKRGEERQGHGA